MADYHQTVTESVHKALPGIEVSVDQSGLERLGFCDLRLFVGMQLVPALFSAGLMKKSYPDVARQFLQPPADLRVHIHASTDDLYSGFGGTIHSSSKLPNGSL